MVEKVDRLKNCLVHLNGTREVSLNGGPNVKHLGLLDMNPERISVGIMTSPALLGVEVDSYALLAQISLRPGQFVTVEKDCYSCGLFARSGVPALSNDRSLLCAGSNRDLTRSAFCSNTGE